MADIREFKKRTPECHCMRCPECDAGIWWHYQWVIDGETTDNFICANCGWDDCAEVEDD